MKTVSIGLDDELDAMLEALCAEKSCDKVQVVTDVLRKYLETERLKQRLQDSALSALYQQLAAEDTTLAEEGISEYSGMLEKADQP